MTDDSANRELAAAQKRVMRAWTRLDQRRETLISDLRQLEQDMAAMQPVLNAVLGKAAACRENRSSGRLQWHGLLLAFNNQKPENTEEQPMPGKGRPFPKGVSGNPGGRPKVLGDVQDLARERSPEAINTLAAIMDDAKGPTCRKSRCSKLTARSRLREADAAYLTDANQDRSQHNER